MKVLIIDDDEDIRFITALSLRSLGEMEVIEADGGADGVRRANEEDPDVILLDVMMPGMDGLETLKALRSQATTARTPVIFLSAKTAEADVDRLKALGATGVLIKPFDPRTLAHQVLALMALPLDP